jgi:hypothetical protein
MSSTRSLRFLKSSLKTSFALLIDSSISLMIFENSWMLLLLLETHQITPDQKEKAHEDDEEHVRAH